MHTISCCRLLDSVGFVSRHDESPHAVRSRLLIDRKKLQASLFHTSPTFRFASSGFFFRGIFTFFFSRRIQGSPRDQGVREDDTSLALLATTSSSASRRTSANELLRRGRNSSRTPNRILHFLTHLAAATAVSEAKERPA